MAFKLSWLAILASIALPALGYPANVGSESIQLKSRSGEGQPFNCSKDAGVYGAPERKLALKKAGAGHIGEPINSSILAHQLG